MELDCKEINPVYKKILGTNYRYNILYGGGSSGKSYFVAQQYIPQLLSKGNMKLLVIRKVFETHRESTFSVLCDVINNSFVEDELGNRVPVSNFFDINETLLRIKCSSGSKVVFKGIKDKKDREKIKSIHNITDIWIEEASELDEDDFNQLDIRMRGKGIKRKMFITFNPVNINHWLKKVFIDHKKDDSFVLKTTYKDNAFISKEDIKVLEDYKYTSPYYYEVYCLGNWGVLGNTIFDKEKISERLKKLKEPLYQGFFSYKYNGLKITDIEFIEDDNGYIKIYELPSKKYQYVIGGDTAGEGSDFFIGNCVNNETGNQAAVLRRQFDADEYARQMYCLGMYYRKALIGIEANFDTFSIMELERLGYENQYVREQEDTFTNGYKKSYGFKTTSVSRPRIISLLQKIVKESIECFNDKETLEEMLTFVLNDKGRAEAEQGCHDDLVMANAITHDIRSQLRPLVSFKDAKKRREDSFIKFGR